MKKIVLPVLSLCLFSLPLFAGESVWRQVPQILSHISPPAIPHHDFVITDYGAKAGGKMNCSKAIAKAINACAQAGGGRVVIPDGMFLTGPIHLKSNMELHLDQGADLKFSTDPKEYLPLVFTRFEGIECYNYSPLIYALDQTNVAVTGSGTLDGQATDANWLAWKGQKGGTHNQNIARKRLGEMNDHDVPVSQRRFGTGDYLRPDFIEFNRCRNVMISGVHIRRSPMWELHPLLCTNVIVRGVNIVSHGPNNDGCDPESCKDVLIEKCLFDTGDDCIAIKSGRNNDGRRIGVPAQDIIVRDCTMRDGHGGVTIGSEISGGCSNVFVENCEMSSPELACVLRLKSNAKRGGVIQNIFVRNINVGLVKDSVLQIDFLYQQGAKGKYRPVARHIRMTNIRVARTPRVLNVRGFPRANIHDIQISDSTFKKIEHPSVVTDADVTLKDCTLEITTR